MLPRGLSTSAPNKTKVGQVAVQNPQCTQVRKILLDSAISGSRSRSGAKFVRMLGYTPANIRPGLRIPFGSKTDFTAEVSRARVGGSGGMTTTLTRTASDARNRS